MLDLNDRFVVFESMLITISIIKAELLVGDSCNNKLEAEILSAEFSSDNNKRVDALRLHLN